MKYVLDTNIINWLVDGKIKARYAGMSGANPSSPAVCWVSFLNPAYITE